MISPTAVTRGCAIKLIAHEVQSNPDHRWCPEFPNGHCGCPVCDLALALRYTPRDVARDLGPMPPMSNEDLKTARWCYPHENQGFHMQVETWQWFALLSRLDHREQLVFEFQKALQEMEDKKDTEHFCASGWRHIADEYESCLREWLSLPVGPLAPEDVPMVMELVKPIVIVTRAKLAAFSSTAPNDFLALQRARERVILLRCRDACEQYRRREPDPLRGAGASACWLAIDELLLKPHCAPDDLGPIRLEQALAKLADSKAEVERLTRERNEALRGIGTCAACGKHTVTAWVCQACYIALQAEREALASQVQELREALQQADCLLMQTAGDTDEPDYLPGTTRAHDTIVAALAPVPRGRT